MTVGQRIKFFREKNKFSVTDFAQLLKTSERNVYNYEADKTSPHMSFWESLFLAFEDLNAKWMLTGKGQMLLGEGDQEVHESVSTYMKKEELTDILLLIQRVKELGSKVDNLENELASLRDRLA